MVMCSPTLILSIQCTCDIGAIERQKVTQPWRAAASQVRELGALARAGVEAGEGPSAHSFVQQALCACGHSK